MVLVLERKKEENRQEPKITIGICVRNSEASVRNVITSMLDQTFPHDLMQLIFVDDGSEDGTLSVILDSVARLSMQVKVYHDKWRGLGPARNTVVENADGEYIIWVDSDTVLPKDYVNELVKFMDLNPQVGTAKGKIGIIPRTKLVALLENLSYATLGFKDEAQATTKHIGTCGSIYRVAALRQVGGFDNRIRGAGEDIDVLQRIRNAGWSVYITPTLFYDRFRESWTGLWKAYHWRGYGEHYVLHKNKGMEKLYEMIPLAAFVEGLLYSFVAYKATRRKIAFILPLHFTFKMTAWCFGFIKSHLNHYEPIKK